MQESRLPNQNAYPQFQESVVNNAMAQDGSLSLAAFRHHPLCIIVRESFFPVLKRTVAVHSPFRRRPGKADCPILMKPPCICTVLRPLNYLLFNYPCASGGRIFSGRP